MPNIPGLKGSEHIKSFQLDTIQMQAEQQACSDSDTMFHVITFTRGHF